METANLTLTDWQSAADLGLRSVAPPADPPEDLTAVSFFNATDIQDADAFLNVDVHYNDSVPSLVDETTLAVWVYTDGEWEKLDSAVNTTRQTVAANITAFSEFGLFGEADFGPPPVVGDNPPRDLNGDGLYEDIDGDGDFDIFDVQALFSNLDSDTVQNHPSAFNFNEDDDPEAVRIFDVQGLFNRLAAWPSADF